MASSSGAAAHRALEEGREEGLRGQTRRRLLDDMLGFISEGQHVVLVVDPRGTRVLNSTCTMRDIMDRGVTVVEKIDLVRQPFPDLDAVYFVDPTEENINRMVADFTQKGGSLYASCHAFFLSAVDQNVLRRFSANPDFVRRVKNFAEINVDYEAVEQRVFSLNRPNSFYRLYSDSDQAAVSVELELSEIARQLVTACVTLKEYPHVRFMGSSEQSATLASTFLAEYETFMRDIPTYKPNQDNRGTLLILDRRFDPVAPAYHDYHLQSLSHDLLDIQDGLFKYVSSNKHETGVLMETNALWTECRHMHIAPVTDRLDRYGRELEENSSLAQYHKNKQREGINIRDLVKQLPAYRQQVQNFGALSSATSIIFDKEARRQLRNIAEVEEALIMGAHDGGEPVREPFKDLMALLRSLEESEATPEDKARLAMVYCKAVGGFTQDQQDEVVDYLGDRLASNALANFHLLDVPVLLQRADRKHGLKKLVETSRSKKHRKQLKEGDDYITLNRWDPELRFLLEDWCDDRLPESTFPFVKPPPPEEVASQVSSRRRKRKKTSRLIVFVLGCLSFSELRSVYQVAEEQERDIIVGSSILVSGTQYVRLLDSLSGKSAPAAHSRAGAASGEPSSSGTIEDPFARFNG